MRILVTGASGFVGRATCRALAAAGHVAVACDRGAGPRQSAAERFPIADITDRDGLCAAMQGCDAVVHLAARSHVMNDRAADPLAEYRRVNVDGTCAVAAAAARARVRRVAFASSVKVNGERTGAAPFTERDAPAPEDAYGISKSEAETALAALAERNGFEAAILRSPLVYGPEVRANFLALLRLCDTAWPLPFGGVTQNRRSLIYVENLASALVAAAVEPAAAGKTFLVRDGEDLSTAALVRRLRRALGRPPRLVFVPAPALAGTLRALGRGALAARITGSLTVDDRAIRRDLGWSPPFSADRGLEATCRWFLATHRTQPL